MQFQSHGSTVPASPVRLPVCRRKSTDVEGNAPAVDLPVCSQITTNLWPLLPKVRVVPLGMAVGLWATSLRLLKNVPWSCRACGAAIIPLAECYDLGCSAG